ncbi:MAG: hypothetical protein ACLSCQ_06405 [Evtepia gabavorous]
MDTFLHTDMQKDTIIHTIHSVTLDPTRSNQVVTIHNIQDVAVNGSSLGLPGYLDIGLIDTMKDLMVNFLGALVFSVTGFFYARSKGKKKTPAQNFVPSKKTADRDYLQQARQALTPRKNRRRTLIPTPSAPRSRPPRGARLCPSPPAGSSPLKDRPSPLATCRRL